MAIQLNYSVLASPYQNAKQDYDKTPIFNCKMQLGHSRSGIFLHIWPVKRDCIAAHEPLSASMQMQEARWRSGDAEDCKSLHPSSILGRASKQFIVVYQ